MNKYYINYFRDREKPKTFHRKFIEGKTKKEVLQKLYSIEGTQDLNINDVFVSRKEVEVHIGNKHTEESVKQMQQVFTEFKKEGGWTDFQLVEEFITRRLHNED